MMRYSKYRHDTGERKKQTIPVWRGIGCILFFLTPLLALAIANEVLATGIVQRWISIPSSLLTSYTVPFFNFTIRFFKASLALGAAVTVMLFSAYFVVYAAMYRVIGPSPYGPTDVPPARTKRKVKKSR